MSMNPMPHEGAMFDLFPHYFANASLLTGEDAAMYAAMVSYSVGLDMSNVWVTKRHVHDLVPAARAMQLSAGFDHAHNVFAFRLYDMEFRRVVLSPKEWAIFQYTDNHGDIHKVMRTSRIFTTEHYGRRIVSVYGDASRVYENG